MSSSSAPMIVAALLAVGVASAGCGFEPLYAGGDGKLVREDLTQVDILPIDDRAGQLLHNQLETMMHPRGGATVRPYRLEVRLSQSKQDILVSKTGFSTRTNFVGMTSYVLRDSRDGRMLLSDSATLTSSYNVSSSDFSTLVAAEDARDRVLRDLAKTITNRVSMYFRQVREGPRVQ
jgi:LPS-assembly lipoprotein